MGNPLIKTVLPCDSSNERFLSIKVQIDRSKNVVDYDRMLYCLIVR